MGESYCFKTFLHNKQFRSYVWCFSPRGYLHFDTYILRGFPSVPRFHNIQPIVLVLPDPPLSFQPFISSSEIGGGTWLIIRPRRFQWIIPQLILVQTDRQSVHTHISLKSYPAGQYSLLWDERAGLCESSCRQSARNKQDFKIGFLVSLHRNIHTGYLFVKNAAS